MRKPPARREIRDSKAKPSETLGVSAGLRRSGPPRVGEPLDLASLSIVVGLALAIACFSVAMIPARAFRWRPAMIFVSERQLDLTLIGMALFIAAALMFFGTKGL